MPYPLGMTKEPQGTVLDLTAARRARAQRCEPTTEVLIWQDGGQIHWTVSGDDDVETLALRLESVAAQLRVG